MTLDSALWVSVVPYEKKAKLILAGVARGSSPHQKAWSKRHDTTGKTRYEQGTQCIESNKFQDIH